MALYLALQWWLNRPVDDSLVNVSVLVRTEYFSYMHIYYLASSLFEFSIAYCHPYTQPSLE
jgi:hypothetical protein